MRHDPREFLPRHCHREPFAAIVLAGGYDEAGDTGRHSVGAGNVILHRPFESHLDRFHRPGAEVLVIPLVFAWDGPTVGVVDDPDAIVRACEKDPAEGLRVLAETLAPIPAQAHDWPDLLAEAIRADPSLSLERWSRTAGLHPASLSRGFASVFGTTPATYRRIQRARRAIDVLARTNIPLSRLALDCGFSDQAHMSREVRALSGVAPANLRGHGSRADLA
jgi:AraC-like DNA-binding protein